MSSSDNKSLALEEAKKHIAAHCECEENNGKREVWRFKKGQGYVWVPCQECAEFWRLIGLIEPAM